ncbi:very short patch repair endonuclease [Dietzia sp. oral taxon 368]|nr:very short patch repair endonuclease [Dietzia sp. oral taxon 368]AVM65836.1 very short patch repair endonuclease [Dietzia sp. oral taxon 368]
MAPEPGHSHPRTGRPAASSETVRANMARQKRRDTGCEMAVRRLLHAAGIRYRVDFRPLPDQRFRVDIGWRNRKLAVFIDGCFWHGCPDHGTLPKNNREWWSDKLRANAQRDRRTDELLRARGWTVLRYWEHEDPDHVASTIRKHLMQRAASGGDPT